MKSETKSLAVIPARGGSKRIPRKNIIDFRGRPLIGWAIEAALESELFSDVIVSTDDQEIAQVSLAAGASVPFIRPSELSGDSVATAPVVVHALGEYTKLTAARPEFLGVIYPAAVFTRPLDLVSAREVLRSEGVDIVMSVGRFQAPVQRSWRKIPGDLIERVDPTTALTMSQELEERFFDAGQFYLSTPEAWSAIASGEAVRTAMYEMEPWRVWDIDTPQDLEMARRLFSIDLAELGQAGTR